MQSNVSTFLMFTGQAEQALTLYASAFATARTGNIQRHGTANAELAGRILLAELFLGDQKLILSDSAPVHAFDFTPSMSLFVQCDNAVDFEQKYRQLGHLGSELMPPDNYGFSQRFAWITDQFGVSWQLNLA